MLRQLLVDQPRRILCPVDFSDFSHQALRALIGSVAERVARLAPCAVMVMRSRS
jgi:hypothetical protein